MATFWSRRRWTNLWVRSAIGTGLILLIPLLGSVLVADWHWQAGGFVRIGAIAFALQLLYYRASRHLQAVAARRVFAAVLVLLPLMSLATVVQFVDVQRVAIVYLLVPVFTIVALVRARMVPTLMARALRSAGMLQLALWCLVLVQRAAHPFAMTPPEVRGAVGNGLVVVLLLWAARSLRQSIAVESGPSTRGP